MRGRRKSLKISEAEWHIMKALWNGESTNQNGMTLGEIVQDVSESKGWSNTTIRTLIIRLAEKGLVTIDKTTGVYRYAPIPNKEESVKTEIVSFINRVFDDSPCRAITSILQNCTLTKEEKAKLKALFE